MLHNPKWDQQQIDMDHPSLLALAHLLRHRELWPVGFEWDFGNCDKCAMGLAFTLWNLGEHPCSYSMAEQFGLSEKASGQLFLDWPSERVTITPEMIADRIDAHTETVTD